ncbi:hypothetical protein OAK19_01285 [Aureispira]|nr:hypothetical protein [Aureispira sp.]
MYRILFFILFLFSAYCSSCQDYNFSPIQTINKKVRWMEVDKMKQLYLIKDDHSLLKYDSDGKFICQFNENTLGEISFIDISNPFRILVYYNDYATVVFLDRTLSEIQRHDFSDLDIPQIQAICTASDNNIWLFDNNSYTLKKVNNQNDILLESADLNLLISEGLIPNRMIEFETKVYLNSPNIGILVFDVFGNYIKTLDIKELDFFQLYEGQIFYVKNKSFKTYHLLSFLTEEIKLPIIEEGLKQLCIAQERLYLRYSNDIKIVALEKK